MKTGAWIAVILGVVVQLFYDLSPLLLPSMASADGVAVYPSSMSIVGGLTYRLVPYLIFGVILWSAEKSFSKLLGASRVAVVIAVFSPVVFMGLAVFVRLPVRQFREEFWPIRPLVQIIVFFVIIAGLQLMNRLRRTS